jgi:hypothetical protein
LPNLGEKQMSTYMCTLRGLHKEQVICASKRLDAKSRSEARQLALDYFFGLDIGVKGEGKNPTYSIYTTLDIIPTS